MGTSITTRDNKGRFVKGHPGVGGRKAGALSLNYEMRKILKEKNQETGKTNLETIARNIFLKALNGDKDCMFEIWHMVDGKPKQQLNIESEIEQEKINWIALMNDIIEIKTADAQSEPPAVEA